jgi:hypothetical protein
MQVEEVQKKILALKGESCTMAAPTQSLSPISADDPFQDLHHSFSTRESVMTRQPLNACYHGHVWERRLETRTGVQRVVRVCLRCGCSELCWSPPNATKKSENDRKVSLPALS